MKWYTKTINVDRETGEVLDFPSYYLDENYRLVMSMKTGTEIDKLRQIGTNVFTRILTKKEVQTELKFD